MIKVVRHPDAAAKAQLTVRCAASADEIAATVDAVLADVRQRGDEAVREYEARFDHVSLHDLRVSADEIAAAKAALAPELTAALALALHNIRAFHAAQRAQHPVVETAPGVRCWQKDVAIERVGLYVPGGTAPLFSTVLMLAVPAQLAGCRDIVLCTPPRRDGTVHPAILAAADMAGVSHIYKVGGTQAIAAMAYGTQTVPRVYKLFGPGNRFVMKAKQRVQQQGTAIDMPAGPSEVCVIADHTARPDFVAADLLSQAEHGADSQALLITTSDDLLRAVEAELARQLAALPRKETAARALDNSVLVLVGDTAEAIALANAYAPEHLIIATADYEALAQQVVNAGSVFLGPYSCESAGDYASGTNHTLPTHGYATAYSGVNLDAYMRKITFQHLSAEGVRTIARAVETMAQAEELEAHANAMRLRRESL